MTLPDLLRTLGRAGVELRADGSTLLHRPASLPPGLAAGMRHHRAALVALLHRGDVPPDISEEALEAFAERLGIAEGLEMPTTPGAPAWAIAMAHALALEESHSHFIATTCAMPHEAA